MTKIFGVRNDEVRKEKSIGDLQTRLVESQSSYNIQIEELKARQAEELEQFKQKAIDELRSDGFYLFKKATEALEESRERILRENSERVKVVTTYAVMELTQFGFSPESYTFIQHKVCTFAETGGKFDKSEQSIIVNPCKNEVARKYGRKKKINKIGNVLTTLDIAHYTRNIAFYLDFRLEDVARFTAYLFKEWYPDGDFLSITKSAAKLPDSGLIKIQEDLEGYIAEQGWG